jgi:hypothetical protein
MRPKTVGTTSNKETPLLNSVSIKKKKKEKPYQREKIRYGNLDAVTSK